MHVTLIHPPMFFLKKNDILCPQCLGILYLAGALLKVGHTTTFIDCVYEGYSTIIQQSDGLYRVGLTEEEILKRIPSSTELIGISASTTYYGQKIPTMISIIRKSFPHIPVVLGGVYPSTNPELAYNSGAEYLCLGDGEQALTQLVEFLKGKRELPAGIIDTQKALPTTLSYTYPDNLDDLALPARHLIPFDKYMALSPIRRGYKTAVISTSRGCPYLCDFCPNHPMSGYAFRTRSPQNVLDEIALLVNTYQIDQIDFIDDNFTLDKNRAIQILDGIIEINRKHTLFWSASNGLRIDSLDEDLFKQFAKSNCRHISLALEHGSQRMLDIMNKKLSLSVVPTIIALAKKYNIPTDIYIIYGYPGETRELFEEGIVFYRKLRKIYPKLGFMLMLAQPYPKTKLYTLCKEKGYLSSELQADSFIHSDHTYYIETANFNKEELMRREKALIQELGTMTYVRRRFKEYLPKKPWDLLKKLYFKIDTFFYKIPKK